MDNNTFRQIYKALYDKGKFYAPRQLPIIEAENFSFVLQPYERFASFVSRKLNLSYIKKEFLWYLKGDRFDLSICEHAKIWTNCIENGAINSNYGQYIFGIQRQFDSVITILKKDKDSRRASIVILTKEHVGFDVKDEPCTYSINFRIRHDKLNMSVHMRSQDAIFGLGNDIPTFSFVHEMVYETLKETYPSLTLGEYHHIADSFHIYERHFEMLDDIIRGDKYIQIEVPKIDGKKEVDFLRAGDFTNVPDNYLFTKWILNK